MQIADFLALLQNAKGGPAQYTARCPAHDDRHNSLSVGVGEDGRILLRCHAGCETAAVLAALGLKTADLFPDKTAGSPQGRDFKTKEDIRKGDSLHTTVDSVDNLTSGQKQAGKTENTNRARGETDLQKCKKSTSCYPYTTAEGELLFETVRISYEDGSKTFRQRQPGSKGEWVYNLKGVAPVLYRLPAVQTAAQAGGEVWLCEGEKDADALAALGLYATTAPMGAGKWREEYTAALRGAAAVYILPDNDKPGRAHALAVAASLEKAAIPVKIVDLAAQWPGLPKKGDVSDVLDKLGAKAAGEFANYAVPAQEFEALARQRDVADDAPPYAFAPVAGYLGAGGDFWRDLARNAAEPKLSTGFAKLDAQLDGRMYPGLYVIGSVSSLGKSAFCLQMADAIAGQGWDVLFFTLEMSRLEMSGRSVVRQLFCDSNFNPEYSLGHLLHGKVPQAALQAAVATYAAGPGRHIAFIEGEFSLTVEEVAALAAAHHRTTGRRPVVFVDYLQILRPADVRMTDKQAMDHNVVALKRLSRELDIPVVAVSSFNRQNYSEQVNFAAFKESGAIEYSADFVLGLQARGVGEGSDALADEKRVARMVSAETKKAKQQDPRPLEAVTLKNRRGPAWACFELDFYAKQNYFLETGRG